MIPISMDDDNHILDETEFIFTLPVNYLDHVNRNSVSKLLFVPFEFDGYSYYQFILSIFKRIN